MKTDEQIQKDVMEELKWQPLLKASQIGVAVTSGVVTLSGTVDTYAKKAMAEQAAKGVAGVKAVAEDIEVRLNGTGKRSDTQIAEAILNALKWDSVVNEEKIKVKVENGWVTLDGEVDWEFQRSAAVRTVRNLNGVVGINNNLQLVPVLTDSEVKHKIAEAFHRNASVDSKKIHIEIDGSKVTLSGTVRSYLEKREAERAAWMAPGVNQVVNHIKIDEAVFAY